MYEAHFNLTCRPFDLAPDPRFLCMTDQHARASANVRFALMNHDSFVVISGEIGTGKTTVLNAALGQLGPQYVTARLVHTTLTDIELLQALLSEFGIPDYGTKKVKLLDKLRAFFLEQHLLGRHVVIIVDEAQHLRPKALEELRLLSCIDSHDRRIVTIVLTGQPSLDEALDDPGLAQLRQRTRLRQRLRPLEETDTAAYIKHRLQVAGGNSDEMFEPEVIQEIHRLTLGIPRLINTLCDTALTACKLDAARQVSLRTIGSVVQELGWRWVDGGGGRTHEAGKPKPVASQGAAHATLRVYSSGVLIGRTEVTSFPFSIGRGHGNDLVIMEKEIGRRHALIDLVDGQYVIEDLNSRNGMIVNCRRCEMAILKSGDVITIGLVNVIFHHTRDGEEKSLDARPNPDHGVASRKEEATDPHANRFSETQRMTEGSDNVRALVLPERK